MQFRNPCRIFLYKMREKLRSVFQNDRTNTMFPKKPFSKVLTEHLECSYDYHEGKIRQKAKTNISQASKTAQKFSRLKSEYFAQDSTLLEKMVFFVEKAFLPSMKCFHTHVECNWKSRRKKIAKSLQKNCWMSKNVEKLFFSKKLVFPFFCSNGHEECKFDNIVENFLTES